MSAPHGAKNFDYPDFARYEMRHNAGHDFARMLDWCTKAKEEDFRRVFAGYARNPLAVLLGGAAIEGYLNYVGHAVASDWDAFVTVQRSTRDKLKRIFEARGIQIDLGSGIYQRTLAFTKFRGSLGHPKFMHHIEERDSPPPTIFDHTDFDYPASRVWQIVSDFRDRFLADVGLEDFWWRQGYAELARPQKVKPRRKK
jgi:hypothetical protein